MEAAALGSAAAVVLLLAAWRDPHRRAWALVTVAGAVLYLALRELPLLIADIRRPGEQWNWGGHLLALLGMIWLAAVLLRRTPLAVADFGWAAPRHMRVCIVVTAAALVASFGANRMAGAPAQEVTPEAWVFLATMPGLVEEFAFRGVLLAAAERAWPAVRVVGGARISAGALLLTVAFAGLHGLAPVTVLSVLPAALLYLWLRVRSGSLVPAIVAHNLWNIAIVAAHH